MGQAGAFSYKYSCVEKLGHVRPCSYSTRHYLHSNRKNNSLLLLSSSSLLDGAKNYTLIVIQCHVPAAIISMNDLGIVVGIPWSTNPKEPLKTISGKVCWSWCDAASSDLCMRDCAISATRLGVLPDLRS